jgi:PBP1b-binding outer membrane lipoprotein LpoB
MGASLRYLTGAAVGIVFLAGCSSSSDPISSSKTVICTKALGVIVLSEASDDAQRRLQQAKQAETTLQALASQTQDASLATALRNAASTAGDATTHDWSPTQLKAWVIQEQARFNALRKACG